MVAVKKVQPASSWKPAVLACDDALERALLEPWEQFASRREGEGEDAGCEEEPGGRLRHGAGRGRTGEECKGEGVDGEWSDIAGVVRIEDVDVVGAVVVDVGEAGSDQAGEGEEIAQSVDVHGVGIGEDKVV